MGAPFVFYEDIRADPETGFRELLAAAGDVPETEHLHEAAAYAPFDNMRRLEEGGRFGKRLRARRVNDPNSLKTRSGRIHSHREELAPDTIAFIERYPRKKLDPSLRRYVHET